MRNPEVLMRCLEMKPKERDGVSRRKSRVFGGAGMTSPFVLPCKGSIVLPQTLSFRSARYLRLTKPNRAAIGSLRRFNGSAFGCVVSFSSLQSVIPPII